MVFESVEEFVESTMEAMEERRPCARVLDITDPAQETRLTGPRTRFSPDLDDSFESDDLCRLLKTAVECPDVKVLFLGYLELHETVIPCLVQLLRDPRDWQRLTLQGCRGDLVLPIAMALHRMESLNLYRNELSLGVFQALGTALQLPCCTGKLQTLCIEDNLTPNATRALATGIRNNRILQTLDLSDSNVTPTAIPILVEGLADNRHLVEIVLEGCQFDDAASQSILQALVHNTRLRILNFNNNRIRQRGLEAMGELLRQNRLEHLSLAFQQFPDPHILVPCLLPALEPINSLTDLHLQSNRIDDKTLQALLPVFYNHLSLEHIGLCGNLISDQGARIMAAQWATKPIDKRIWRITLERNRFGRDGAQALLDMLSANPGIYLLRVDPDLPLAEQIDLYARLNYGGRRLLSRNVPLGLWPFVLERLFRICWCPYTCTDGVRHDVIYHLLRGPALFERHCRRRPSCDTPQPHTKKPKIESEF